MYQIYKNIKDRRIALGMSQTTLAEKMGYLDKSMISRIENGQIDLAYSKVLEFAKVLNTTPSELMGWKEEMPTTLDDGQRELLSLYANCEHNHRESAVHLLELGQLPPDKKG